MVLALVMVRVIALTLVTVPALVPARAFVLV
jgi:hypothetical protein